MNSNKAIGNLVDIFSSNANTSDNVGSYYQKIIDMMPNNVYWLDRNCVTLGCNRNVLKLVGLYSLRDFVGITYEKMGELAGWTEGQAEAFKKADMEVIATGKPKINIEEPPLYNQDGDPIYYLSSRVPLFDDNHNVVGVVGISVDITERKKSELALKEAKEKAEAANIIKSQFMQNMEHDIRTPAAGVCSILEAMMGKEQDPEKLLFLTAGRDAARRLIDLCNEVLDFRNIDYGFASVLEKKFDIRAEVEAVFMLEKPAALTKELNFTVHVDDGVPNVVKGDDRKLRRILINIVGNAIKFTKKGDVNLIVKYVETRDEIILLQFIVRDTGIGIPEDKIDIIYEEFGRGTPSNQNFYRGTGLGLRVVKKFVDELGGEINVDSQLGEGTTFTVTLPFQQPLTQQADKVRP